MRASSTTRTPFDEGKKSAQFEPGIRNPHTEGSIEYRNYELGRQYGIRNLRTPATVLTARS